MQATQGLFQAFQSVALLGGKRTPMVDYCGALSQISPTDLGIKAARAALETTQTPAEAIESVLCGNMAPGDFEQFMLPRHVGLYAGCPITTPALMVQRICGTGFELFRQAAMQIQAENQHLNLVVGTESMSRNPICAFEHRTGFRLGAPVGFKDFMWEALRDSAVGIDMIQTAENLAKHYGITREAVDAFAAQSFDRALQAQANGFFEDELCSIQNETFQREGFHDRTLRLTGKTTSIQADTHPRPSPVSVLSKLRAVHRGGVQTSGNSSALVDGAAACIVASGSYVAQQKIQPLAWIRAAAVVGVPPDIMGIGPAPAIRRLLQGAGLALEAIDRFEINEAQGAQTLAVAKDLGLNEERLNVHGGAIALGHPLACTGVRLTLTLARTLQRSGKRFGVASACIGGGQGIALLLENAGV